MASDLPALWKAVRDRVNADTGSGGLLNVTTPLIVAIYNTRPPEPSDSSTVFPYIVYSVFESENTSTFRTRAWKRRVRFDTFVEVEPNSTLDVLQRGSDILRRLEGDWEDQVAGTAPTFGFDRFQPTLTGSGWSADIFELVDSGEDHSIGDRLYTWSMTFDITTSKAGA